MSTVSTQLEEFLDFINEMQRRYIHATDVIKECDLLTEDYLHMLELKETSYNERSKIATKLKDCRIRRREYKDIIELLLPIVNWYDSKESRTSVNVLRETLGKVRKKEALLPKRIYSYRVLKGQI